MIDLLLACAPDVHPVTMAAVVKQESGGHPWTINDNTEKKSYRFESKDEAAAKAIELISAGHSVDIGLAQINSRNLAKLGLSVNEALDPCKNIAAGAKILKANYEATESLPAALSAYNTGKSDSERGRKYAEQVFQHAGVAVPAIPGGKMPDLPEIKYQPSPSKQPPSSSSPFQPRWY